MTSADKLATDALARHLAYLDGEWWETVPKDRQAVYRARALDYVQVVGPIYQQALDALSATVRAEVEAEQSDVMSSIYDAGVARGRRDTIDFFPPSTRG